MSMYRIALVSMPFARIEFPSLALTQLKAVTEAAFPGRVAVEIQYLNQDFATFFGMEANQAVVDMSMNNGIGEWFFRQAAFPDLPDNTVEYFQRSYPRRDEGTRRLRQLVIEKRQGLEAWLASLIDAHALDRADLVGFTSMFSQNVASIAMARLLKARNPGLITVIGGANCEQPMGAVLSRLVPALDYVFSGPALKSFPCFVGHRLDGREEACSNIPGVYAHHNVDSVAARSWLGEELPIDHPIPLDYDDFLDGYERRFGADRPAPSLLFETSRGCWWGERAHCTFCGLNGLTMRYRSMAPENAVAQIRSLFRYAERGAQLQSVDNILPKSYLREVLPQLGTPEGTSIFYEVKADLADVDFRVLADARVSFIQPGIESLSTGTLKLMRKGTTSFQNIALLKNCLLHGIDPAWNLLVGFPGEPGSVYEKYLEELPSLVHLPPPIGVSPVRFDRYSPYFTRAAEYGLALKPFDFYGLTYPFEECCLDDLAYYFYDDRLDSDYITDMLEWIDELRIVVQAWKAAWASNGSATRPALHLEHGPTGPLLIDTRLGRRVERPLPATTCRVLELLERPKDAGRLAAEAAGIPGCDVEAELDFCRGHSLLFGERGRFMSLVLLQAPQVARRDAAIRNPAAVA
jgi:magnesium-protoporphyrin IX monomethyl ester (oxidative) cyclase